MDTRKIKKLIELVQETGIGELEVKSGEESVRISCHFAQPAHAPALQRSAPIITASEEHAEPVITEKKHTPPKGHHVKSPMVGTVYLAPTPGASPFVNVGDRVNIGDTLCFIEAMKVYNKIEADASGVISARLADNGQPVEYDQSLFVIDTTQ